MRTPLKLSGKTRRITANLEAEDCVADGFRVPAAVSSNNDCMTADGRAPEAPTLRTQTGSQLRK